MSSTFAAARPRSAKTSSAARSNVILALGSAIRGMISDSRVIYSSPRLFGPARVAVRSGEGMQRAISRPGGGTHPDLTELRRLAESLATERSQKPTTTHLLAA